MINHAVATWLLSAKQPGVKQRSAMIFRHARETRRGSRHGQMDLSKAKHYMRNQSAIKTFRFGMDLAPGGYRPAVSQAKSKSGAD